MEQVKNYKTTLTVAIACTTLVVLNLIVMIRSKDGNGNNFVDVESIVFPIAITIVSLLQWIKGVKQIY